ncbi:MAG TPA: hypothetical protein VF174_16660 [Micromonosporaceae bacterium]
MPAPDATTHKGGRPLLTVLFWIGVGLAAIAAVLLLVADSNGLLRIAAVLALLSVVLIGLSVSLRGDAGSLRDELEEVLFEEIDGLHRDVRKDIETAARATHRSFGEKLQALQSQVELLREQLAAGYPQPVGGAAVPPGGHAPTADPEPAGNGPGHAWESGRSDAARHRGVDGHPGGDVRPGVPEPPGRARFGRPAGAAAVARPPTGVVRHTETVQVTRHTIVGSGDEPSGAVTYGRAAPPRQPLTDAADETGWTDGWTSDRWAAAHADERGREFRVGERRAAIRADEAGMELRVEDRWAAAGSWSDGWDRSDTGPGHPGDYGYPARGFAPQVDFGPADERWR